MSKLFLLFTITLSLCFVGCSRSSDQVWDDTLSCGKHVGRGFKTLGGKHSSDSRQVQSRDDFYGSGGYSGQEYGALEPDFIPLDDDEGAGLLCMEDCPPSRYSPGDPGSAIPGIDSFRDPSSDPRLSKIFKPVYFEYNSNVVEGASNLAVIQGIANYMKQNPGTYVFVEGHCDQRGPEAFNLALGTRRSNEVRALLVREGANPDNLFTVSYGKERPATYGTDESAWRLNRRAEFRIYTR